MRRGLGRGRTLIAIGAVLAIISMPLAWQKAGGIVLDVTTDWGFSGSGLLMFVAAVLMVTWRQQASDRALARAVQGLTRKNLALTQAIALDDEIDTLGQMYQEIAVAGACQPAQRDTMIDAGRRMIAAGADAIVLAGTDLNLAFDGHDPGYPVIDALDVHVDLLADIATGRVDLETVALQ